MPIIAVDLGNSRAKFGYFPVSDDSYPEPASTFADTPGDFDSLKNWLTSLDLAEDESVSWRIARTGDFPWGPIQRQLAELRKNDGFDEIGWQNVPMPIDVEFPEKLGIDRLLAAYAGLCWKNLAENLAKNRNRFEQDSRSLVVDAGSATTVDLVSADGMFAGGAILPGFNATADSLAAISSRLPRIATDEISFAVYPGKNTEEALAAGIYWGTIGAIRQFYRIVQDSLKNSKLPNRVPIFLTGGDAERLYAGLSMFVDSELLVLLPDLVLSGIALTHKI